MIFFSQKIEMECIMVKKLFMLVLGMLFIKFYVHHVMYVVEFY